MKSWKRGVIWQYAYFAIPASLQNIFFLRYKVYKQKVKRICGLYAIRKIFPKRLRRKFGVGIEWIMKGISGITARVVRGGSYFDIAANCDSSYRRTLVEEKYDFVGFRLVIEMLS